MYRIFSMKGMREFSRGSFRRYFSEVMFAGITIRQSSQVFSRCPLQVQYRSGGPIRAMGKHVIPSAPVMVGPPATKPASPIRCLGGGDRAPSGTKNNTRQSRTSPVLPRAIVVIGFTGHANCVWCNAPTSLYIYDVSNDRWLWWYIQLDEDEMVERDRDEERSGVWICSRLVDFTLKRKRRPEARYTVGDLPLAYFDGVEMRVLHTSFGKWEFSDFSMARRVESLFIRERGVAELLDLKSESFAHFFPKWNISFWVWHVVSSFM